MRLMMTKNSLVLLLLVCTVTATKAIDASSRRQPPLHTYVAVRHANDWLVLPSSSSSSPPSSSSVCAEGTFDDAIDKTGWSYLSIKTRASPVHCSSPLVQSEGAGYLEGHLSYMRIHQSVINSGSNVTLPPPVQAWLDTHTKWTNAQIAAGNGTSSAYFRQVASLLAQLRGLVAGYTAAAVANGLTPFPEHAVRLLTMGSDLETVGQAVGVSVSARRMGWSAGKCSALVKWTGDELLAAQTTWSDLNSMLRTYKFYDFQSFLGDAGGAKMQFSSYPGTLFSADDFYMMWPSKLTVFETTIGYSNASLSPLVKPECVLEWQRTMIANRLADGGEQWTSMFAEYNSGTYNNEFMVVDYKLFTPGKAVLAPNTFWVIDQIPGHVSRADRTAQLATDRYFASYNSPSFVAIFNISGELDMVAKYGDWFTHDKTPRAMMFKRDHSKVTDLTSMRALMRYNDFKHDPLSRCDTCVPPYSAENAIACRDDLNPINMTVPFGALGHRPHISTDCKVASYELAGKFMAVTQSSPTFDQQPVFVWSESDYKDSLPHVGHPDRFDFDWVTMTDHGIMPLIISM